MNNPLAGMDPTGYVADCFLEIHCNGKQDPNDPFDLAQKRLFSWSAGGSGQSGDNGKEQQAQKAVKNAEAVGIGSQSMISNSNENSSSEKKSLEPFKLSTTIDLEKADDIDKKGFYLTERMVDMTKRAIEKSGDETLINEMNNTEFVYDPNNKVFENNPDVAAFRLANENSTTLYVGRKLIDVSDPNLTFPYHKTTIRGGDTGLLFVGLHEFGHVVGRQYANIWTDDKKERFANSFAKKHYPRRLSGTDVNRKDIKFAKGIDE